MHTNRYGTLFDMDKPHYAAWCRVYDIDIVWPYFTDSWMPDPFPLYRAAQLGFYDLAAHLIAKHPGQVNATGGWNRTPLVAALGTIFILRSYCIETAPMSMFGAVIKGHYCKQHHGTG